MYSVDGKREVKGSLIRRLIFDTRLFNIAELVGAGYVERSFKLRVTATIVGLKNLGAEETLITVLEDGVISKYVEKKDNQQASW